MYSTGLRVIYFFLIQGRSYWTKHYQSECFCTYRIGTFQKYNFSPVPVRSMNWNRERAIYAIDVTCLYKHTRHHDETGEIYDIQQLNDDERRFVDLSFLITGVPRELDRQRSNQRESAQWKWLDWKSGIDAIRLRTFLRPCSYASRTFASPLQLTLSAFGACKSPRL